MIETTLAAKAEQLVGDSDALPTIPTVATRILALLDQGEVNLDEVADLMLADQILTARALKIINSPVFRPTAPITSLKAAVVYLGVAHIREIILTTSLIDIFDGGSSNELSTFWEHSFGVGMVAKVIAGKAGYRDVDKAYIAGVIHDIGIVFLSSYHGDGVKRVQDRVEQGADFIAAEVEEFGASHCEVGLCLAKRWNFPDAYCEVIACHHNPYEATLDPVLSALVNLANLFWSVHLPDYGGWVSFNLATEPAWKLLKERCPELKMDEERFRYELEEAVNEVQQLVASIFNS